MLTTDQSRNSKIQDQKRNPWFISHDELRKSGAIQNGKFVVSCDIEFNLPWSKLDNIPPIHCLLLKTCPQVKLIVGEDTVEMNKAILTSISPVFNAMFSHDTKEARTGSVRIPDFDFNTVQNVRRFCLGVEFDFTTKECIDMLKFADKYDIKGLQDYLEVCLINNLTADNFCAVADYAWTHSRDTVKINCAQYFSNYGEGVFLTSAFAGLEPTIMASLVKAAVEFTSK
uniref:BTB domain-containing protein n=1 Tax=Panagrellus redivivus TaxID=6233 RepID=A0A7E4ZSU6_PANRE